MVNDIRSDLSAYYEAEAAAGTRGEPSGHRIEVRQRFVELLVSEGRTRMLDVGAGPGSDASAFVDEGIGYVGIDLAVGNASLAASAGWCVIPASLFETPFRPNTFDAGWTMSTLMHVPEREFHAAMESVVKSLCAGSPLYIGMWGGAAREFVSEHDIDLGRRMFSLRTPTRNRELIEAHGEIERFDTYDVGPDGWEYHFVLLRC